MSGLCNINKINTDVLRFISLIILLRFLCNLEDMCVFLNFFVCLFVCFIYHVNSFSTNILNILNRRLKMSWKFPKIIYFNILTSS